MRHAEELKNVDKVHRGKMKVVYQEMDRKMRMQHKEEQKLHEDELAELKKIHVEEMAQYKVKVENKQNKARERFTRLFETMESKRAGDIDDLLDENKELHQKLKRCKSDDVMKKSFRSSYLDLEELD